MRNPLKIIGEVTSGLTSGWYDVSRSVWWGGGISALRSLFGSIFGSRPAMMDTQVTYDLARSLYRNDDQKYNLGSGFVHPVIDLSVEYIGIPYVTSDSGNDEFLNECIEDYWSAPLLEAWRDALRDSKTVVRFRQPRIDNPLFTQADREHGAIECIPPELVDIQWNPTDPNMIDVANVRHSIEIDERTTQDIIAGRPPSLRKHDIIETITPEAYVFYDNTDNVVLSDWSMVNPLRFVPLCVVYNEYSADLGGGQSDIEPILPFIEAFHDVLYQTLNAHKLHSTPKIKFKVKSVQNFLKNNYPHVLDENGRLKAGSTISWNGRETFLLEVDEDVQTLEVKSVLADSRSLLEFLIDCIAIASETPKWALLKDQGSSDKDATVQPFEKKITRKRTNFAPVIVMLCKMVLVANGKVPDTVTVAWHNIRLSDLAAKAQAFQQLILGADVASQHEWLSDETIIAIIGTLFPEVDSPAIEKRRAKSNVVVAAPAPAPQSPTQALPPASTNGHGKPQDAKKALATTKASAS